MRGRGSLSPVAVNLGYFPWNAAREAAGPGFGTPRFSVLDPMLCGRIGERMQEHSTRLDARIKRIINNVRQLRDAEHRKQTARAAMLRAIVHKDLGRFARPDRLIVASGIGLAVHPDGRVLL